MKTTLKTRGKKLDQTATNSHKISLQYSKLALGGILCFGVAFFGPVSFNPISVIAVTTNSANGLDSYSLTQQANQTQQAKKIADTFVDTSLYAGDIGSTTIQSVKDYIVDEKKIKAKAVLVKNLSSNGVLYQKNQDEKLPLASLTKLMTAITVTEMQKTWKTLPTSIKLISNGETLNKADRKVTVGGNMEVDDLVSYMLLSSSNFAAYSLSHELIPNSSFIAMMNHTAKKIGLRNSTFIDSIGLTKESKIESERNSMGSASDITKVLKTIISKYPNLASATKAQSAFISTTKKENVEVENTNILLSEIPGIVLGKTGFTDDAGGNLAVVIKKNDQYYSIVVFGSTIEGRFEDVRYLASQL